MSKQQDEKLAGLRAQLHQISEELNDVVVASWRGLAADYMDCSRDLEEATNNVNDAFAELTATKRALAEVRKDATFHSGMALLAEISQGKEGKINGSNEPNRKLQREVFLGQLPDEDAQYKKLYDAIRLWELNLDQATVDYETAKNQMSAIRNRGRMIAGLGNAMSA